MKNNLMPPKVIVRGNHIHIPLYQILGRGTTIYASTFQSDYNEIHKPALDTIMDIIKGSGLKEEDGIVVVLDFDKIKVFISDLIVFYAQHLIQAGYDVDAINSSNDIINRVIDTVYEWEKE